MNRVRVSKCGDRAEDRRVARASRCCDGVLERAQVVDVGAGREPKAVIFGTESDPVWTLAQTSRNVAGASLSTYGGFMSTSRGLCPPMVDFLSTNGGFCLERVDFVHQLWILSTDGGHSIMLSFWPFGLSCANFDSLVWAHFDTIVL